MTHPLITLKPTDNTDYPLQATITGGEAGHTLPTNATPPAPIPPQKKSPTSGKKLTPREARRLCDAITPKCKRCKVQHDYLRDGLCPGCYDEMSDISRQSAPIPPRPQITTGSRNITIGAGPSDNGTWHRAVMVAIKLNEAGLWNGTDHLTLNHPYQLHQRLFGIEHASPADLIPGQDYVIKQPAPPAVKLSLYDQQCCRDAVIYNNPIAQAHVATFTGAKAAAAQALMAHFRRIESQFRALQAALAASDSE